MFKSKAGKLVSPLCCHALVKFTLVASVPSFASDENDDSRSEQPSHALEKLLPVLRSRAGKLVSPLDRHAFVKFTLLALVPSLAPAGNFVRSEQDFQADVKLAQTGA